MKSRMITLSIAALVSLAAVVGCAAQAQAASVTVTVDARRGPWDYTIGGLNTLFQYGVGDQMSPVVISGTPGFDFSPGGSFTITYLSGLTNYQAGTPFLDASGDPTNPLNDFPNAHGLPP